MSANRPIWHTEGRYVAMPRGVCYVVTDAESAKPLAWCNDADEARDLMRQLDADEVPPLPSGPCPDGIYRADSGEIIRIHHGRHEPTF